MITLKVDVMAHWRSKAISLVESYINNKAVMNTHSDMLELVKIARGQQILHPAEHREYERNSLKVQVMQAQTIQELHTILEELGPQYVLEGQS